MTQALPEGEVNVERDTDRANCPICGDWRDSPTADCANCGYATRPCGDELGLCVYAGPHDGPHKFGRPWAERLAAGVRLDGGQDERDERLLTAHAMLGSLVQLAERDEMWPHYTRLARKAYDEARQYQATPIRALVAPTPSDARERPVSLDAAWAEAEAALPGVAWMLELIRSGVLEGDINPHTGGRVKWPPTRWYAVAGPAWDDLDVEYREAGPTPAAALQALAARLRAATTSEPTPEPGR